MQDDKAQDEWERANPEKAKKLYEDAKSLNDTPERRIAYSRATLAAVVKFIGYADTVRLLAESAPADDAAASIKRMWDGPGNVAHKGASEAHKDAEREAIVPDDVVQAIQAYGDARSDGGDSAAAVGKVIRLISAALTRAASPQAPAVDGAEAKPVDFTAWLLDKYGIDALDTDIAKHMRTGWDAHASLAAPLTRVAAPIPMILHCPKCGTQHIDAQEPETFEAFDSGADIEYIRKPAWTNPPHRSHLCHSCGTIWRPADVATTGVASISTKGKDDNNAEPLTRVAATVTLTDGQIIEYGRSFPALLELLTREPARVAFTQCYRAMLAASPAAESKTLPRESEQ